MKTLLPSWIDKSVVDGLEDVSGLIMVNRTVEADFLEAPLSIVLPEPRATHPEVYQFVLKNLPRYHRIYTFDVELLQRSSGARKLLFGTSFLNKADIPMKPSAKVGVSFLCGSKQRIIGQQLRQLIYKNQSILELRTGRELSFWRSGKDELLPQVCQRGNPIIGVAGGAKKELHAPFHFSIILENSQQDNYFTEKLIDCFLCKTVPIYWGCPNIGNYFNTTGLIILRSTDNDIIEELITQLMKCTPELYERMYDAVETNYDLAFNYAFNYSERLKKLVHT
jgi:hypothetical protein